MIGRLWRTCGRGKGFGTHLLTGNEGPCLGFSQKGSGMGTGSDDMAESELLVRRWPGVEG